MNVTLSQTKAEYLEQVRGHLVDIPSEDLEEVVQDLEAHLAELDDADVEAELGTPTEFAREFRISAGIQGQSLPGRLGELRATARKLDRRIEKGAIRLGELTRWPSARPGWIWVRGWLLIGAWAVLNYEKPFRQFPIPSIGGSTAGLMVVATATWLSVWLERAPITSRRRVGTRTFSTVTGIALMVSLFNPLPSSGTQFADPAEYIVQLTAIGGRTVENIYAYDVEGNPVEVLLFDQDGEPLLTMPEWSYDEARFNDGQVFYGEGAVRFATDEFGRIIPNLYPLEVLRHDPTGVLQTVPPPSIGFPDIPESNLGELESTPTTITDSEDPQQP